MNCQTASNGRAGDPAQELMLNAVALNAILDVDELPGPGHGAHRHGSPWGMHMGGWFIMVTLSVLVVKNVMVMRW